MALHAGKTKLPSQPEDFLAGISSDFWRVGQPHGMMNGLARLFDSEFTESGVLSSGVGRIRTAALQHTCLQL